LRRTAHPSSCGVTWTGFFPALSCEASLHCSRIGSRTLRVSSCPEGPWYATGPALEEEPGRRRGPTSQGNVPLSIGFSLTAIASIGSAMALIVFALVSAGHLRVRGGTGAAQCCSCSPSRRP
jgi:hypothetical protein